MTYQSTGEVRVPKDGEYYLGFSPDISTESRMVLRLPDGQAKFRSCPRVIMVPVVETFDELSD